MTENKETSAYEQVTRTMVASLEGEITDIKKSLGLIWKDLTELRNRPPVWVTMMFTFMGGIIGACLAIIWK